VPRFTACDRPAARIFTQCGRSFEKVVPVIAGRSRSRQQPRSPTGERNYALNGLHSFDGASDSDQEKRSTSLLHAVTGRRDGGDAGAWRLSAAAALWASLNAWRASCSASRSWRISAIDLTDRQRREASQWSFCSMGTAALSRQRRRCPASRRPRPAWWSGRPVNAHVESEVQRAMPPRAAEQVGDCGLQPLALIKERQPPRLADLGD
jgi:hypothetical protein